MEEVGNIRLGRAVNWLRGRTANPVNVGSNPTTASTNKGEVMYLMCRIDVSQDSTSLGITFTGVVPFKIERSFSRFENIDDIDRQLSYFPEAEIYNNWEAFSEGTTVAPLNGRYPKIGSHFMVFKIDSILSLRKKEVLSEIITYYPEVDKIAE